MRHDELENAEVCLGDGLLVVRPTGTSGVISAKVLGTDKTESGEVQRIWLDRLIHPEGTSQIGPWRCWGALTTVLEHVKAPIPRRDSTLAADPK